MDKHGQAPQVREKPAEIIDDDVLDNVIGGSNTSLFRISHPKGAPQAYAVGED